jgi:hypothetical protein
VTARGANTGVFVLGAARSGTSLVTRIVNLLGLSTAREDDLKPADDDNPRGYFESRSLTSFNRQLLLDVGGAPYGPAPRFPSGWEHDPALDEARREARALMERIHPTTPWVWKDPRTCLTLPFWIDLAGVDPIVVVVYRDPLEVAGSLVRRDDAPVPVTLGVWERYNRAALANARDLPTFVVRYDQLVQEPRQFATDIGLFLGRRGLSIRDPDDELEAFVDPTLRRSRPPATARELPSPEQLGLLETLDRLQGAHDALPATELPPETDWVDDLLEAERRTGILDELRIRRQASREAARRIARRRFLGVELRIVRGSPAWRILAPFARIFGS